MLPSGATPPAALFLTEDEQTLFLTPEKPQGPLTLNLDREDERLRRIRKKTPVQLNSKGLSFPSFAITYPGETPPLWNPPQPAKTFLDLAAINDRLEELSQLIQQLRPSTGLSYLLSTGNLKPISENAKDHFSGFTRFSSLAEPDNPLAKSLIQQSASEVAASLAEFIGVGPGLTPSGDDFIVGVILSINRWMTDTWKFSELESLNSLVISEARVKTTFISTDLIRCAAGGQADERLLGAIDYLFTGEGESHQTAKNLLNWGASSGIDTLAGISLVVRANKPKD